jgi:hypothetical protein
MEPLTLTTVAATLVLTKALEKTGEKLGESVMEQGAKVLKLIKERFPETGSAIERGQQQSLPAGSEPYLDAEFIEIAEAVEKATQDPEIATEVESLGTKAQSHLPQTVIENWKGINIKGGNPTITGNTFNF